jgi:protein phosphatase
MEPHPEPLAIRGLSWSAATDVGKIRKNNEDTFLAVQFDSQEMHYLGKVGEGTIEHTDYVFAVSDGMGGALAGEFASKITAEKIAHLLPRAYKQAAVGLAAGFEDVLEELFDEIHKALLYLGGSYAECSGMGATLSLSWFTPGWMYFAHIGDSRIYYLPARLGGLRQVTHDDTYIGWLFRQGQINEREAKNHPRRNVLQKALGAGHQFTQPHVGAVACEPGDLFLLCTDGVSDGLYDAALLELLRQPDAAQSRQNPAHRIVEAAVQRSGRDNTTALVVEVR